MGSGFFSHDLVFPGESENEITVQRRGPLHAGRHCTKLRVDRFPRNRNARYLERVPREREIILSSCTSVTFLIRGSVSGDLTIDKVQSLGLHCSPARELECAPPAD
jgi:hypothetical protein